MSRKDKELKKQEVEATSTPEVNEDNDFLNALQMAESLLNDPNKVRINLDFTDLEEDDEKDDDIVDDKEDNGKTFSDRMLLKLKMSMDRVKKYYSNLRNYMSKYDKITFRSNNSGDVYLLKNKTILKVTVFSRALKVYLALNPKEVDPKYNTKNVKDKKKYENIPVMLRVSSDRSYKYLIELIDELAKKQKLTEVRKVREKDYTNDLESNTQELLQMLGYDDLLVSKANIKSSEILPNNVARNCQILLTNPYKVKGQKEVFEITVGELSQAFKSKYDISLPLLKMVGIAPESATALKVVAKGACNCKLSVAANDYDIEALKMIIITGGNVIKYVN